MITYSMVRETKMKKFLMVILIVLMSVSMMNIIKTQAQSISTTTWYKIVNQNSGKCIDDANWGTTNGSIVQQYGCGGTQTNQQWQFVATDSGYYQIVTHQASCCLAWDATNNGSANGTKIQEWF